MVVRAPERKVRDPAHGVLYQVVAEHLDAFLDKMNESGPGLPAHVRRELAAYLDCGVIERGGAACLVCEDCGKRVFVPLSCKRRGFCPSCCGRRMCDIAAHLVDHVLPDQPVRQWVLSLPIWVRFVLLRRRELVGRVLGVLVRVVTGWLVAEARRQGATSEIQTGVVAIEQKFGDGARLNFHIHVLALDGAFYRPAGEAGLEFMRVRAPGREELARLALQIKKRVLRTLRMAGIDPEQGDGQQVLGGDDDALGQWQAAGLLGRVAMGPRAGWRVVRVGAEVVLVPPIGQGLCAEVDGFNLHAGVHVGAGQRDRVEALLRYMLRPPLAQQRLTRLADGRILVGLKKPWPDGTFGLSYEPMDFLA